MRPYEDAAAQVEKMVGDFLRGTFGPDAFLDTTDGLVVALGGSPVLVKVSLAEIRPTDLAAPHSH